jgi:hypothetical protein
VQASPKPAAGDGFAHLVGFSSNRLVPILRAGDPDDPTVTGGPAGGWGFSVRTQPGDIDGASVWMLKWCAALRFQLLRVPMPERAFASQGGFASQRHHQL